MLSDKAMREIEEHLRVVTRVRLHDERVEEYRRLFAGKCGAHLYLYALQMIAVRRDSAESIEAILQALGEIDWRFKDYGKGV